ncbi:AGAP005275-PA-like protein [Anopheles sinensis]|uniref:AGAP005275-PA-like protein n=1 Tax=Anopheles sinensis TaxID=74873 RepID=A0A084VXJ5_ANOSI|nr:AGAP005275-PA-like protein [Anopheles sinensis]
MGCKGRETLHYLCEQIPGDALLYSMFKINPEPIKCPLSVEELTCLAWWKDGNSRYLVGLVSHHHATSNEERFRCFVYEKLSGSDAEYKLAQSGDATCNGLESAEVGSRIMTLKKAPLMDRCDFPVWFKGPRFWHALMGSAHYVFDASDGSLHIKKPNGHTVARSLCEQINKQTASEMMVVVHHTMGCKSGFMCVMFYRRDTHVAELQMGTPAARLEDACTTENFDVHRTPFVTLLANNSETQLCPMEGQYMMKGFLTPTSSISRHKRNHNNKARAHRHWDVVGYRNQESAIGSGSVSAGGTVGGVIGAGGYMGLEAKRRAFLPRSRRTALELARNDTYTVHAEEGAVVYTCLGHWQENQTTYIIAKHAMSQHGVCISYVPTEGSHVQVFVGDTCHRAGMQSGQHRSMPANVNVAKPMLRSPYVIKLSAGSIPSVYLYSSFGMSCDDHLRLGSNRKCGTVWQDTAAMNEL